jgi:hypothetical protein
MVSNHKSTLSEEGENRVPGSGMRLPDDLSNFRDRFKSSKE